jgi:flagellar biosynthesis anti-sigma factor FlgM
MDIQDIQSGGPSALEPTRGARAASPAAKGGTPAHQSGDSVSMSDQAQAFQEARRLALAIPDVRLDRVEALRQKYAAGELRPDPQAIARALVTQGVV